MEMSAEMKALKEMYSEIFVAQIDIVKPNEVIKIK